MSEHQVIEFEGEALEPEAPGIASRAIDVNDVRWAVVEYEPGVLREEWCLEGHCGYVLEGEVTYEFENGDEPLRIGAGQGLLLPDGAGHRGRAGERGAKLFIIDRAL